MPTDLACLPDSVESEAQAVLADEERVSERFTWLGETSSAEGSYLHEAQPTESEQRLMGCSLSYTTSKQFMDSKLVFRLNLNECRRLIEVQKRVCAWCAKESTTFQQVLTELQSTSCTAQD